MTGVRPPSRPRLVRGVRGVRRKSVATRLAFVLLVLLVALLVARPREARAQAVYELKSEIPVDITVTALAISFIIITESYKDNLAPQRCRWCDFDGKGHEYLNPLDRGMRNLVRWRDPLPSRQISDVTAFVLSPMVSMGTLMGASINDRAELKFPTDMLLTLEAISIAGVLNQTLKFTFARERPFVHAMTEDMKPKQAHPSDNNLSFYSGHTSLTFAIAAASGTIASMRDYRLKSMVWGSLVPLAALTGYLRIAGDRHYFTDVLTGAVLGSAVGVLIPLIFHPRTVRDTVPFTTENAPPMGVSPAGLPPMINVSGAF